jgi:hypothetical protein
MLLSLIGMAVAAAGYLPPVAGAVLQELIDVAAVLNALRMAILPRSLTDYESGGRARSHGTRRNALATRLEKELLCPDVASEAILPQQR